MGPLLRQCVLQARCLTGLTSAFVSHGARRGLALSQSSRSSLKRPRSSSARAGIVAGPGKKGDAPGQAKAPLYRWLDQVAFPAASFPVCPLYVNPDVHGSDYLNTGKDTGCIINSPQRTMAHPMIDFDPKATADAVLKVAAMPADSRGKPVITIARGMGGGKTRALESVRRLLLHRDGVLPLAITFNTNTPLLYDSWLENMRDLDIQKAYAVSLAARMVSAVFGVEYSAVANRFKANLALLDLSSYEASAMIRDSVTFLVDRVNSARAQQTPPTVAISTVVVLLDESRKMNEFANHPDLGAFARSALLDESIAQGLSAALVFSDLSFRGIDLKSTSGRAVRVLALPARLNSSRVVSEWWGRDAKGRVLTDESRGVLELVAASLNNMPRALEIADDFLRSNDGPINSSLLVDLYEHVFTSAQDRYSPSPPSIEVLSAMFFREAVPLDDTLFDAISRSVVTNPITEIAPKSEIFPEASLALLKVLSQKPTASSFIKMVGEGIGSVLNTLTPDPDTNKPRPMGDVLEEAGLQALRSRLALARFAGDMTLARLCGVGGQALRDGLSVELQRDDFENQVNVATAAVMFAPLKPARYDGAVDRLSVNSRGSTKKCKAFLAELDALVVDKSRPVRLIRSAESESWDMCVKARDPATGGAFLVFFDDKSSTEFKDAQESIKATKFATNPKQYANTKAVLGPSRPFLYVYRSTYPDLPSRVLPAVTPDEADLPSRCMVLGRDDTLALLGPFAEIYKTARAALGETHGGLKPIP